MKTRSNMPLFVVECEDVKALSNAQIDLLRCGDYLVKKDASGEHAYKVTYKSDTGMCITYMDASVIETQSYDKIDGVWTYNSEDKTPNLLEVQNVEDAPSGTIVNALGLNSNGDLVKGTISGGTQWYVHRIALDGGGYINVISTTSKQFSYSDYNNEPVIFTYYSKAGSSYPVPAGTILSVSVYKQMGTLYLKTIYYDTGNSNVITVNESAFTYGDTVTAL